MDACLDSRTMSDAWDLAHAAAEHAGATLRPITTVENVAALLAVERATWGDQVRTPSEMVLALAESGNVPIGAEVRGELIGFVLGWIGVNADDGLHVHSHQLAAMPDRRHRGVGYALKLAQRAQALDAGITLVRWTFDPLVSRNAWFNLVKLGASADKFLPNYYGDMADELNRGDRSDRLLVRWDLERGAGGPASPGGTEVLGRDDVSDPQRPGTVTAPTSERASIRIPREYHALRSDDPALAMAWRDATGEAFALCFEAGMVVQGFTDDSTYVLGPGSS
jgi:predicted GNAT superfamily acetyltransferase